MNWESEIRNTMKRLHKCFDKDELAYLAFSQKVERPLRDKIAWILHKKWEKKKKKYHIVREYGEENMDGKKWDLVILKKDKKRCGKIQVMIEFKAITAPLTQLGHKSTIESMKKDIGKCFSLRNKSENHKNDKAEIYFIQFLNVPATKPKSTDLYICHMAPSHAREIHGAEDGETKEEFDDLRKEWEKKLDAPIELDEKIKKRVKIVGKPRDIEDGITAGSLYGNRMTILYWIIKLVN